MLSLTHSLVVPEREPSNWGRTDGEPVDGHPEREPSSAHSAGLHRPGQCCPVERSAIMEVLDLC